MDKYNVGNTASKEATEIFSYAIPAHDPYTELYQDFGDKPSPLTLDEHFVSNPKEKQA